MYSRGALKAGLTVLACATLIGGLSGCPRPHHHHPTVTSTSPLDGEVGVPVNRSILATFSEEMDPSTITAETFTLMQGDAAVSGEVSYEGLSAVFNPSNDLLPNTVYTARISTGAEALTKLSDPNTEKTFGFLLLRRLHDRRHSDGLADDVVWTFTTGDLRDETAPLVSATIPANNTGSAPLGRDLAATFSEAMDPTTITTDTFTLWDGQTPIPGVVTYTGVTATFAPDEALEADTTYTAVIAMEATDLAGNPLEGDYVWMFGTGDAPDIAAPMVSSTSPANGATQVQLNTQIAAVFSEPMRPTSITAASFTLMRGSTSVAGAVTYSGVTALFIPTADLLPNTTYAAAITTLARDLAGNALASQYNWTFTTGTAPDTTAPAVSATNPANNAEDVPLNTGISVTFSEPMNPLTVTTATFSLFKGLTPVAGTVTYSGVTATFTPALPLDLDSMYIGVITMEAADLAGNSLEEDYLWSFLTGTTPETTPPTVISSSPVNGSMDASVNSKIVVTFSEAMNPLTITTTTFTLRQGTTGILGTVAYSGVTATFTPNTQLESDTVYTGAVSTGAEDLAGNRMENVFEFSFMTGVGIDMDPPTILSTSPVEGAIGVPLNGTMSARFSEAMDPLTITTDTFRLDDGVAFVDGAVSYAGDTATFTPLANLVAGTTYTATVLTGAADLSGQPLATEFEWTFTTGTTTAQQSIELGSTNTFAILAGSTVSSTGASVVTGDLGVSPGTAVVGFPPATLDGAMFTGVASAAGQAKEDLTDAFMEAADRSVGSVSLPGNLTGLTLFPGLYTNSTSVMLSTGAVTLDAQGDANAVFLFQMGSTLTTGSSTQVILAGGAKASNVYWQVGTSATLGTTSVFKGNILAQDSITLSTGANLEGRALTQSAAVTLDGATVTVPAD